MRTKILVGGRTYVTIEQSKEGNKKDSRCIWWGLEILEFWSCIFLSSLMNEGEVVGFCFVPRFEEFFLKIEYRDRLIHD
jgi:hypothetical protein